MVSVELVKWEDVSYYLVEIDVHTLQLEVGRPVVPGQCEGQHKGLNVQHYLHASAIQSMLA